jgi:hypothetical protein
MERIECTFLIASLNFSAPMVRRVRQRCPGDTALYKCTSYAGMYELSTCRPSSLVPELGYAAGWLLSSSNLVVTKT